MSDRSQEVSDKLTMWKARLEKLEAWLDEKIEEYEQIEPNYIDKYELETTAVKSKVFFFISFILVH